MLRVALLAAVTALATLVAPARAADPTLLVATDANGDLWRVTLVGRVALPELLYDAPRGHHMPTQAIGNAVSFAVVEDSPKGDRYDVGVVDAGTGAARALSRDGRSGFLLRAPDGHSHYVLKTDADGFLQSLVRVYSNGRVRTLVAKPRYGRAELSGAGITADGRTIYLAQSTPTRPSVLFGVDTASGEFRVVRTSIGMPRIHNVVVSPDGSTLAVSYADLAGATHVALVDASSGDARELSPPYGVTNASAFSRDGSSVVLTAPLDALPVGVGLGPGLALADVATGAVTPVLATEGLYQAVPVA